jgi:hypothetical protein
MSEVLAVTMFVLLVIVSNKAQSCGDGQYPDVQLVLLSCNRVR